MSHRYHEDIMLPCVLPTENTYHNTLVLADSPVGSLIHYLRRPILNWTIVHVCRWCRPMSPLGWLCLVHPPDLSPLWTCTAYTVYHAINYPSGGRWKKRSMPLPPLLPPPPPTRRPLLPDLVPARFPFDGVFPPHVHKVLAAAFVIAKDTLREYRFSVKYFQTARELVGSFVCLVAVGEFVILRLAC